MRRRRELDAGSSCRQFRRCAYHSRPWRFTHARTKQDCLQISAGYDCAVRETKNSEIEVLPATTDKRVTIKETDFAPLFERCLNSVRPDLRDNTYILEGLKVLQVGGYRSAIGSFWNAVVDDLRNKVIARSLKLFNKSVTLAREIKSYEDFQNYVNDDQLIEGSYAIGVIP
jgi:hypothetical protein